MSIINLWDIFSVINFFHLLEKVVKMQVKGTEYHARMNPEGRFQVYISGKDLDSGGLQSTQVSFVMKKPELCIEVKRLSLIFLNSKSFGSILNKQSTNSPSPLPKCAKCENQEMFYLFVWFKVPETIETNKDTEATIIFKNTTRLVLTQAEIAVEGSGLLAPTSIRIG